MLGRLHFLWVCGQMTVAFVTPPMRIRICVYPFSSQSSSFLCQSWWNQRTKRQQLIACTTPSCIVKFTGTHITLEPCRWLDTWYLKCCLYFGTGNNESLAQITKSAYSILNEFCDHHCGNMQCSPNEQSFPSFLTWHQLKYIYRHPYVILIVTQ